MRVGFNRTVPNSSEQMQWGSEATGKKSDLENVGLVLPSTLCLVLWCAGDSELTCNALVDDVHPAPSSSVHRKRGQRVLKEANVNLPSPGLLPGVDAGGVCHTLH